MIVTVSSGKGGVGKTTTVLALAAILGAYQHRHGLGTPIVLDLDPRSDATRGIGIQPGGNRYETLFAGAVNGVSKTLLAIEGSLCSTLGFHAEHEHTFDYIRLWPSSAVQGPLNALYAFRTSEVRVEQSCQFW